MSPIMDSTTTTSTLLPNPSSLTDRKQHVFVFDSTSLQKQANLPNEFIWPNADLEHRTTIQQELNEPLIDLGGFRRGEVSETARAAELIRSACLNHGFFQVTNHGIEPGLIRAAYDGIDTIFKMPIKKKMSARSKPGNVSGYSGAHAERFSSKLPWKETFSFEYRIDDSDQLSVVNYFKSSLGEDFEHTGRVYQKYCEEMKKLTLIIMELLGISLGVNRFHYRKFFEDGSSIMRCNSYPPCNNSGLALGTGPHCDPTSLTLLHQDQVGGLEVFANNTWQAVRPRPDSFVVNIGDTFTALSNGRYNSCLHRAVVNRERERTSLVFFVSPREDKMVRPPQDLISQQFPRKYPDFTWSNLFEFTQKHYRADVSTLHSFFQWLNLSSISPSSL